RRRHARGRASARSRSHPHIGNDVGVARNSSLTFRRGTRLNQRSRQTNERRAAMGKIVISTNVSLDGVVQDPDGKEGFRLGGWFGQFGGKDLEAWGKVSFEEALNAEALLLGRRSDEWFAERWQTRGGEWADRLNTL